jgi:nitric oxide reductase NorD protein
MRLPSFVSHLKFWEPEESVGHALDALSEQLRDVPSYPEAAVALASMQAPLGTLFRGLGGDHGVAIKAGGEAQSHHRRRFSRRLARGSERVRQARFDGADLLLPETVDAFPEKDQNRRLYIWLAALAAVASDPGAAPEDALQRDVAQLGLAHSLAEAAVEAFPGLVPIRDGLYEASLAARPTVALPAVEATIESWIRARLAGEDITPGDDDLSCALAGDGAARERLVAPSGYRPFRPAPVWLDRRQPPQGGGRRGEGGDEAAGEGGAEASKKKLAAERQKSDQAERRDSLILHRFESILAMADFLNLNRAVEDDDEASARQSADDADKLGVVDSKKKPKTRLKLDLDLAPQDADREKIDGIFVYPEWDWKTKQLEPARTRILENFATPAPEGMQLDRRAKRRVEAVRRRFEALRPRRRMLSRQAQGVELDLDELVRAVADRRAGGHTTERLYRDVRNEERDLAVAVLLDTSRSTESSVHGASVISIAREALVALARGLDACGDRVALYAFSSLRRDRVFIDVCKTFDQPLDATADARIAGLKPGFYTRLGAAIRHVSFRLDQQPNARKLLLVLTDGKPNDLDHYEGRFGIEDTRHAVQEARRMGQAVFAITVDAEARSYLPYLFGRAGYALAPASDRLIDALPAIYRHVVA